MSSASLSSTYTTIEQTNAQLVTLTQKYLGNKEYVLSGTNTGYIGAQVDALAPFANLANRYYPTVATLPQSGDNIKTHAELGGYFTPNNLGVSTYTTKNITPLININLIKPGEIYTYVDPSKFNKGRGLTQNDQDKVITHIEDKNWLKASSTDTNFDGQVKDSDLYQKFIPYQSNYESVKTDVNGVINVKDDFEFWKGTEKDIWKVVDKLTEENWLKYFDINSRVKNLLISPTKELYCWSTDVYGNQYALYKTPPAGERTIYKMQSATGELWVKKADGTIYPATSALSAVYKKYSTNSAIYTQLLENKIINFEVFNDTFIIDLNGYTLYEKIDFIYEDGSIKSHDNNFQILEYYQNVSTRLLSSLSLTGISITDTARVYYGGNWYDENNKKIISCLLLSAGVVAPFPSTSLIVPVLYENNLNSPNKRIRIFPNNSTDFNNFIFISFSYIEPPVITYNKDSFSFVVNYISYYDQNFNIISSICQV